MAATSSRMYASDLNGNGYSDDTQRTRRASPSYEQDAAPSRYTSNSNSNGRRLTPERALDHHQHQHNDRPQYQQGDRRQQGNGAGGGYRPRGGGGADFMAERRAQRDASTVSIWPPSPRTPRGYDSSEDEKSRKKRKKDKKHRSSKRKSKYSDTDSESDDERSSKKKKKSSSSKRRDDTDSEDERERRRRKKEKKRSSRRSKSPAPKSDKPNRIPHEQEDEWAEVGAAPAIVEPNLAVAAAPADKSGSTSAKGKGKAASEESSDDEIGPQPAKESEEKRDAREYGGALLRGEGEAMAAFVAEGQRIPRRGEIGLESVEIEKFENAGYVMSGSRHRRMNAVRMRKENQVISAEEKRGILKLQKEEKDKKENLIVGGFKELVEKRLASERSGPRREDEED